MATTATNQELRATAEFYHDIMRECNQQLTNISKEDFVDNWVIPKGGLPTAEHYLAIGKADMASPEPAPKKHHDELLEYARSFLDSDSESDDDDVPQTPVPTVAPRTPVVPKCPLKCAYGSRAHVKWIIDTAK
jgi:hypothetical protein